MKTINITQESRIPLVGCIAFGVIDRGSNLLQIRATSACNLKCRFCSVSAHDSTVHPVEYYVDINYLIGYVKEIIKIKGSNIIAFIDSVGEPLMHPKIKELVEKLKQIKEISRVIIVTNGVLLNEELVDEFEKSGLDQINLSINSLDERLSYELAGCKYDIEHIIRVAKYISKSKIKVIITPVWIPNVNDEDIIKLIKFSKELKCRIGLQKYEEYKYSRKIKEAKKTNYYKFYKKLEEWEKEFNVKLKMGPIDFGIEKRQRIPTIFNKNDKIQIRIACEGWFKNELIGIAKNRCITVVDRKANINDLINVKVTENKNNIYIAR